MYNARHDAVVLDRVTLCKHSFTKSARSRNAMHWCRVTNMTCLQDVVSSVQSIVNYLVRQSTCRHCYKVANVSGRQLSAVLMMQISHPPGVHQVHVNLADVAN